VRDHIVPRLRSIAKSPAEAREFTITQAGYSLNLRYSPGQGLSSAVNYRAYRNATKKDSNPLFNALEAKRQQLRDTQYDGCRGIIVCDGGCELLSKQFTGWDSYSKEHVVKEIFRRSRSVSFVAFVWVERVPHSTSSPRPHRVSVQVEVNAEARDSVSAELESLLRHLPRQWPQPIQSAEDVRVQLEGRARRQTPRHWGRRFGGHKMGAGPKSLTYRMSARELIEILAGRRAHEAFQKDAGFGLAGDGGMTNPFENALRRGFTISDVKVERVPDQDDDWIEFRMTGPDPALARFQVPS
jgi:hypothetical protein